MSKRVLVIDDDESIRHLVEAALTPYDYEVMEARNGADALERCSETPPDLILLDMRMPVMDGPAFLERYRKREGAHAPVVVFTASVDPDRDVNDLHPDAILPKPFNIDELISVSDSMTAH